MSRTRRWISRFACCAIAGAWLAASIPSELAAQNAPAPESGAKATKKKAPAKRSVKPAPKSDAKSGTAPVANAAAGPDQPLAEAYNAAGRELFRLLAATPGNVVLSPYSIGTAMAMVVSAARGATETEMRNVLKLGPRTQMETANADLLALLASYNTSATPPTCPAGLNLVNGRCELELAADQSCPRPARREDTLCVARPIVPPSAKLLIANALMLTKEESLVADAYIALLRDKFGAELFKNAKLEDVNGWVKQKTEDKIEKLLDQLDPQSIAVILNAVYFKAAWAHEFSKNITIDADFNLSPSEKVQVPTMRRNGEYAVTAGEGFRAIRIPYSVKTLSMVVVLPQEIDGARTLIDKLDAKALAQTFATLQSAEAKPVDLALPRFVTNYKSDLIAAFQKLGMKAPFVATIADFSGMTERPPGNPPVAIGQIMHSAVIDVKEEGTEAAAATAVEMVARSAAPRRAEQFKVDRPFLFYIVDDKSGAILFQGRIADPR